MQVVHFDVIPEGKDYLAKGRKLSDSLSLANASLVAKAEVITCRSRSRVSKVVLDQLPKLKLICTRTTGFDHIDLNECRRRGIAVYFVPDYCTGAVAEHVFALLLTCVRKIQIARKETESGRFSYRNCQGYSLEGKTLGVVGTGRIGVEVVKIALAFKMRVIAYDIAPNQKLAQKLGFGYFTLRKLLKESDVISLHLPLVPKTHHLINSGTIKLMKRGVILINVSRGAVIDAKALIEGISKFRYICLDVLEDERGFTKDNLLLKYPEKILITPHCAFFTEVSVRQANKQTMENITAYLNGDSHRRIC